MKPETRRSINKKLAILMADASLSLRIPRLRTFKNFVQSLNGSYVPPTSRTLLKIMDDYVNEIDGHNRKLLAENAARVVITADCWTSFNANTGLLAISGHIVSPDFGKRENFILDCVPLGQERTNNDARVKLKQFGEELLTKTKKYFTKWFDNATVRIATLLDPRFAFEEKIMYADQWRNTVDEFVGMQESGASASGERNVDDVEKEEPQKSVALTSFWDPIVADEGQEELGSKRMRLSTEEDELKLEVQRYMLLVKKKRPDKDSDPLKWWSLYKQDFSLMSRKAHQYLSIPATSVDCERMFSIASIAYGNKRRGRLSCSHARLLLMVKAHENRDAGRECKYWTRWEMKRYSAKERTEESSSDDDDSSSCGSDEAEMSEELGSRGFSDDNQR